MTQVLGQEMPGISPGRWHESTALNPWGLSLFFWSGWLTQWLCLIAPADHNCPPRADLDAHAQLEVPDPIEIEGEHALFA